MKKPKFRFGPSDNFAMAEVMVKQWKDERLTSAKPDELVKAYGVSVIEADGILKRELQKRKWIS